MHGDTLSSVRFPNSVEARLKKAENRLRELSANMQDLLAAASQVNGQDGANTGLGVPDADTITATFGSEFSGDGHFQPKLRVAVDPLLAKLRGFAGYSVRLTSPDGSQQIFRSTIALAADENSIVVNDIVVKQLAAPPSGVGSETYTVAVRVENSLFGIGRWSDEVPVTTASDTTPPAQPVGLTVTGTRFNVVHVDWTPAPEPDYAGTLVYVTRGFLSDLLVATVKGTAAEFNYDSLLSTGWVNVYIKHFDKSNNVSIASAAVPLVARKAQNGDLDVITDPTRFSPWTGAGAQWVLRDSAGVGRTATWVESAGISGNMFHKIDATFTGGVAVGYWFVGSLGNELRLDPDDGSAALGGGGRTLRLDTTGTTTDQALNLGEITPFTVSGTLNESMFFVTVDSTAGNVTLTLPPATVQGRTYPIKRLDTTAHTVKILAAGTDTIDGAASVTLPAESNILWLVSTGLGAWQLWSPHTTRTIDFIIGGTGSILTVGDQFWVNFHFPCTITGVTLTADVSGSTVIDILKTTYVSYPAGFTSICASAKPTITSAQKSEDLTLTGWTTQIQAGDILKFNVNSVTSITQVTLGLRVEI